MDLILQAYNALLNSMSTIEIVATFFWVLTVYFTVKQNIWLFPTGLVMVTLYIFIFYEVKLYSDMILQIIYVFMNIYGWYYWLKQGERTEEDILKITTLSWKQRGKWFLVWIVWSIWVGYMMKTYTDAVLPLMDSSLAVGSLIAQWFLSKKILENWYIWVTLDVFFIGMFYYKGLYLTAGLYGIFLVLATIWAITWYKSKNKKLAS